MTMTRRLAAEGVFADVLPSLRKELDILPLLLKGSYIKQDGEAVIDADGRVV